MRARVQRGAVWGAVIGGLYFAADLLGAFFAVGWLFDPTLASTTLLLPPALACTLLGALAGALVGSVWRWPVPSPRTARVALAVVTVAIVATGYGFRSGRNHEPAPPAPPVSATHPAPVLWIVIDTLRADTVYGPDLDFPLTPGLRDFARDALVFTEAESTAGWTIPSVAAYFTGIHNTTMDASAGYLADWAPTMAERLRAAGYATHAVVDNAVIEPRNGYAAGFETYFQRSGYRFAFTLPSFRMLPDWVREGLRFALPTSYHGAPGTTDEAIARLAATANDDEPLFLYVHYMDPHGPYHPHGNPDPPGTEPITFWRWRDRLHKDTSVLPTEGQMKLLRHRYAGEIQWLDPHVARLLRAWHERFGDRGLILITSDHGEEFLEHKHLAHSMTVHRELTHVPLLLHLPEGTVPDERARGILHQPVSLLDILPTTLDALGVEPVPMGGPPVQGRSWLPWLRNDEPPPDRPLLASHSRHGRRTFRYREGNWVYVKTMFYDDRPTERGLFNLDSDPFEQHSVLDDHPDLFHPMSNRFETLAKALWQSFDPEKPNEAQANEEALRALGYIQ